MKSCILVVIAILLCAVAVVGQPASTGQPTDAKLVRSSFGKLPLCFVENRGVYADEVRYYIQGADKTLFFTDQGVTIALKGKEQGWTVKLDFAGGRKDVRPKGLDKQQAVFSYFKGSEKDWKAGLPTFSKVIYRNLWPGIDLVYNGTVNKLKYEFVVAPGADPAQIRLQYRGASSVTETDAGALRVETPEGSFEDAPPVAWQEIKGKRVPVTLAYALGGDASFGFAVGDYDRTKALILDPAIFVYCGYIGGDAGDEGHGIVVDRAGNAYVTGQVYSGEKTFPVAVGPDTTYNASGLDCDAFVAKVNAQGSGLIYCGYIGGAGHDQGWAIAVDGAGNAYVGGSTKSDEKTFPVTKGPDLSFNGKTDAFVAKVNAKGTALTYCGYIGGAGVDGCSGIAVDGSGGIVVAGGAASDQKTFPVVVGPDLTFNSLQAIDPDAFVAKVNPQGSALVYCGYIGGGSRDWCTGVALDSSGNAYVGGCTRSTELTFPVRVGPDLSYNGGTSWDGDAFVAKVNAKGSGLVYCGYIGGAGPDRGVGIAVDSAGHAHLIGHGPSDEKTFPVKVGPDLSYNGGGDAFVAKVSAAGTGLVYCGYIGGVKAETGEAIAVDTAGNAYVTGLVESDEKTFPAAVGPDLTFNGGWWDAYVAKVSVSGRGLIYCGYIGGDQIDIGEAIAVGPRGNAYVTGWARSDPKTFPVAVGPDVTYNGNTDIFVAKVGLVFVTGSGSPRPGGVVSLTITSTDDAGLSYQVGSSLAAGWILIDSRRLGLGRDSLLAVSVGNLWPQVFVGYAGLFDAKGRGAAAIRIPNDTALIGTRAYTAFVTLQANAPSGIKSISNTYAFTIAR